jgi:hypothetical protein
VGKSEDIRLTNSLIFNNRKCGNKIFGESLSFIFGGSALSYNKMVDCGFNEAV